MVAFALLALLVVSIWLGRDHSPPAGRPASAAASRSADTPQPPPLPSDNWHEETGTSRMDGSKTVILSLEGNEAIQGWLDSHAPTLVLRCQEHKTALYVDVGTSASVEGGEQFDAHTVRLRIDQEPAFSEKWTESTDSKALFAPEPVSLIRKMEHGDRLLFQFVPFNADPATTSFDIKGLAGRVGDLAKACGWKP